MEVAGEKDCQSYRSWLTKKQRQQRSAELGGLMVLKELASCQSELNGGISAKVESKVVGAGKE